MNRVASATTVAAAAMAFSPAAPAALASGGKGSGGGGGDNGGGGRRLGLGVATSGAGTLGSPWTLKSKHDDDGPGLVAGEEFEIDCARPRRARTLGRNGRSRSSTRTLLRRGNGVGAWARSADTGMTS